MGSVLPSQGDWEAQRLCYLSDQGDQATSLAFSMKREEEAWVFTALHSGFVLLALTMATHLWSHVLLAVVPLRAHTQGRTCSKIIYYRTQRLLLKLRLQLYNRRHLHEEEPRAPRENRTEKGAPKGLTQPSPAQPFLAL